MIGLTERETRRLGRKIGRNVLRVPTEHEEQVALMTWWSYTHKAAGLPLIALFAVPNGGVRHARTAGRLKAEGVRAGVPDLVLAAARAGYHGAFVEMKRVRGSKTSPEQVAYRDYLAAQGYAHYTAHGWRAARCALESYLGLPMEIRVGDVFIGPRMLTIETGIHAILVGP